MKKCSKCKEEKEISNFYKSKRYKDGLYPSCKDCGELYYTNNIDRIKVRSKEYRALNDEKTKAYRIKYNREHIILECISRLLNQKLFPVHFYPNV